MRVDVDAFYGVQMKPGWSRKLRVIVQELCESRRGRFLWRADETWMESKTPCHSSGAV